MSFREENIQHSSFTANKFDKVENSTPTTLPSTPKIPSTSTIYSSRTPSPQDTARATAKAFALAISNRAAKGKTKARSLPSALPVKSYPQEESYPQVVKRENSYPVDDSSQDKNNLSIKQSLIDHELDCDNDRKKIDKITEQMSLFPPTDCPKKTPENKCVKITPLHTKNNNTREYKE